MNRRILAAVLLLVCAPALGEHRIVLLGISENMDLMQRWATIEGAELRRGSQAASFQSSKSELLVLAPAKDVSMQRLSNTLYKADAAIVVVDSTIGPLPHNREHALLIRQARVPTVAIMLANVQDLFSVAPSDARELLQLIDVEMREVLTIYEVGGADTLTLHDAERSTWAPASADAGIKSAAQVITSLPLRQRPSSRPASRTTAAGQAYILTEPEAPYGAVAFDEPIALQIWSEGTGGKVTVSSDVPVRPGDLAEISISSEDSFSGDPGSRFLLFRDNHVVGVGILTN